MIEIERKFLVKELPNLDDFISDNITQWYLSEPGDDVSIRIRRYEDGRCYYDMKRGGGKIRQETGWKCTFNDMEPFLVNAKYIKKVRYKKYIDNVLLIVDIFDDGFQMIEIESNIEYDVDNFEIPDWFGEEVTDNIAYSNNWIAYKEKGQK